MLDVLIALYRRCYLVSSIYQLIKEFRSCLKQLYRQWVCSLFHVGREDL